MQLYLYFVGTEILDGIRQNQFLFIQILFVLVCVCFCNFLAGNRTECFSVLSRFHLYNNLLLSQLFAKFLRSLQIFRRYLFFMLLLQL